MRGEHLRHVTPGGQAGGSSPHARGAQDLNTGKLVDTGLIPACAGSTTGHALNVSRCAAHPRMRGEHACMDSSTSCMYGSSPHARGAQRGPTRVRPHDRLIPACAGSTARRSGPRPPRWAHPRMRGEHLMPILSAILLKGSSPHARGARRDRHWCAARVGLIPACAGSTSPRTPRTRWWRAHPRMRGEHVVMTILQGLVWGSSPHARGARHSRPDDQGVLRLIPACAGSTSS